MKARLSVGLIALLSIFLFLRTEHCFNHHHDDSPSEHHQSADDCLICGFDLSPSETSVSIELPKLFVEHLSSVPSIYKSFDESQILIVENLRGPPLAI